MKNKLILALALVAMLTCLFTIAISAATTETIDGIVYSVDTGAKTATITNANQRINVSEITIPSTITVNDVECTVSVAREAFKGNKNITKATIALSINKDSDRIFENATNLQTVVFAEGVTVVPKYIFSNCTSLASVTIPSTLTTISNNAFRGCSSLASVDLKNVTTIEEAAFYGCSTLDNVTIPETVTSLAKYTFQNSGITSIVIPSTLTSINEGLFSGCSKLTSVTIPETITSIGKYAFQNSGLLSVEVPSSVTSFGESAFQGCASLTSITLPDTVKSFSNSCFRNCTSLTEITLPKSMNSYNSGMLAGCTSLVSIKISEENKYFKFDENQKILLSYDGKSLYQYLSSNTAKSYTIPETITTIKDRAFCAAQIETIVIPSNVTSIGSNAFEESSLKSITWPEKITSISYGAFLNCSSLTEITIPSTVTVINDVAFKNCTALNCALDFTNIKTIRNSAFEGCSSLEGDMDLVGVTSLGGSVFYKCSKITSVIIYEGVTEIGGSSFRDCTSLKSVKLPSTVVKLNGNAFQNCSSLTNFEFTYNYEKYPEFGSAFTTIGNGSVFANCSSLTTLIFPNSLTHVDNGAFSGCSSLQTLILGASFATTNQCQAIPKTLTSLILSETYYSNGLLFAWDNNKFTCPTTLVVYYTGSYDQAVALQAKNTSCWEVSHSTLVSYEEFTSKDFVRDSSVHYMVYGYNKCEAFYKGEHNKGEVESKFLGQDYVTDYVNASTCTRCALSFIVGEPICGPLFDDLGYSTEDNGTAFAYAIIVNSTNIDKYIEVTGDDTLVYGFVVGKYTEGDTGDLIGADGVAKIANSLVFDFTEPKYDNLNRFELKFTNITNAELGLYCNAYVINDTDVSYIGAVTEDYKAQPITFANLPKKDEE